MALTDENMVMPVTPYGGSGNGFGGNDGWAWIILLLLIAGNGWGGFGGFGGANGFAADGAVLYPWMNQSNQINDGFRDQMLNTSINGIQNSITSGFGDVQNALCGGFAGVNAGVANGFAQAEIANNARQIANMNQAFASQTAITGNMNDLAMGLQNCCCENRAGLADLKFTVATEACADRSAISDALRDVIASNTANTQAILDKMCQQEIEALKAQNANLQTQVNMQNLAASQTAQTAQLIADNTMQTQYIVNRVAPYPIPAYTVANPVTPATTA